MKRAIALCLAGSLTSCATPAVPLRQQVLDQCQTAYQALHAALDNVEAGSLPRTTLPKLEQIEATISPFCPPPAGSDYASMLATLRQMTLEALKQRQMEADHAT